MKAQPQLFCGSMFVLLNLTPLGAKPYSSSPFLVSVLGMGFFRSLQLIRIPGNSRSLYGVMLMEISSLASYSVLLLELLRLLRGCASPLPPRRVSSSAILSVRVFDNDDRREMRDQGMRLLKSYTWVIQNRSSSIGGGDKTQQDEGILGAILRLFLVTIIIHDGVQYGRLDYRSTMLLLHSGRSHPTSDLAVTDIAAVISGWFEADEQNP
jgi:hypothetical protein